MGLIISRFRRKKTTIEILEDIDKEINRLQKNRKENQDRQKRVATGLIIYSIILYILSAIVFFLLYFPDTWPLRLLYSLPLLAFPFLIWGIKKLLHWYFIKRIAGNDLALRDLREKKKQILEDVMETETYKKAKEILEKFDPARFKKLERDEQTSPVSPSPSPSSSGTALHQRKKVSGNSPTPALPRSVAPTPTMRLSAPRPSTSATPNPYVNTPLRAPRPLQPVVTPVPISAGRGRGGGVGGAPMQQQQIMQAQAMPPQISRGFGPPGPPMPRSVLPRERGMMDKMMDYLVGDGPENRYALICRACHSHNGMALREEFEYMSFRCCYCFVMNPARKQRPLAPRLEFFTPNPKAVTLTKPEQSDDDDEDSEDSEDEVKGNDKTNKESSSDVKNNQSKASHSSSATSNSSSSTSVAAMQTPVSSRNKDIPSRSKLPIADGSSKSNTKTSGQVDPKNNTALPGRSSHIPARNISVVGSSSVSTHKSSDPPPLKSSSDESVPKTTTSNPSVEANKMSDAGIETEKEGNGGIVSHGNTSENVNVNLNCFSLKDGKVEMPLNSDLFNVSSMAASMQIAQELKEKDGKEGWDFGENQPSNNGKLGDPIQCEDEYEMVTVADSQEAVPGVMDLQSKTASTDIAKDEEEEGITSARSC